MAGEQPTETDLAGMRIALEQAQAAYALDEVPVGAVVMYQGQILGWGHNLRESSHDPTSHAEMLAIARASQTLGDWRLEECVLYATLEPCPMCAGAILQARIPRLVFGATDPKAGAVQTLHRLLEDPRFNHRVEVRGGVLAAECGELLTRFFRGKRQPRS